MRIIIGCLIAFTLAGCATAPVVVTENLPHYVILHQNLGLDGSDATLRLGVDRKAAETCGKSNRTAKLPAHKVRCFIWHMFLPGVCVTYQYTYVCTDV